MTSGRFNLRIESLVIESHVQLLEESSMLSSFNLRIESLVIESCKYAHGETALIRGSVSISELRVLLLRV